MPTDTSDCRAAGRPEQPDWIGEAGANIPVLPTLAAKVIAAAGDPDVGGHHLSRIIATDQVLATRLLTLANSAYSSPLVEITTVPEAILRIGILGVRNLAVTVCFASRLHDRNVYGPSGPILAEHGIGTAYLGHLIAEDAAADVDPDEAFLCGLLHDIGKLVMLKWYHDRARWSDKPVPQEEMDAVIAHWHTAAAAAAFRRWGLPPTIEEPVICHHDFTAATSHRSMAAVVHLANCLAHRYGFGCTMDQSEPFAAAMAELGLTEDWLAETDARAPGLFAVAREALN
jgi:HD-like signal output (HDOD) protein